MFNIVDRRKIVPEKPQKMLEFEIDLHIFGPLTAFELSHYKTNPKVVLHLSASVKIIINYSPRKMNTHGIFLLKKIVLKADFR